MLQCDGVTFFSLSDGLNSPTGSERSGEGGRTFRPRDCQVEALFSQIVSVLTALPAATACVVDICI